MKSHRAAPILLLGFGMLIGLIAITGAGALQRARDAYRAINALDERYRRTERALDAVGSGMYVIGLLARDYLLDPSPLTTPEYRGQLLSERSSIERQFQEIEAAGQVEDRTQLDRLRSEANAYWDALDPMFTWTPAEKTARSWSFLRHEILPRRESALSITREIHSLAQANLDRERREIDNQQSALANFIRRMLGITVLVGLTIASITVFWMGRLELRSREQRRRTEAAEEELRRLSRQLVHAQEQERKSISRELHDEVGQTLTALRMELRSVQDLRSAPEEEFHEHAESAKRLAEQAVRAVKDMAMGLRPSMLDDLGLGSAVQWQARQFSKHTGIPVNVLVDGLSAPLPERHRICAYRLVQEALTNCARHAKASTVDVNVIKSNGNLRVSVKDDGKGFDPAAVRGRGLGLIGIEERILELGGKLTLVSGPQQGTAVAATIPLNEEATTDAGANPPG